MKQLKTTLILNALSSGMTGLILVCLAGPVATLFDVTTTTPFMETGLFLLLFAGFVVFTATRAVINLAWVKIITLLDILWVVASIVVLVALVPVISIAGTLLIAAVALWVSLMAGLQYKWSRKATGSVRLS